MANFRLRMSRRGIISAALQSREVRDTIAQEAEQTASRARGGTDNEIVVVHAGESRARSYVWMLGPTSAADEAKHRILGRALGRI